MTLVTVYVDASLLQCGTAGAGGYIVRNGVRAMLSGPLTKRYPSSTHAELAAVGAVVVVAVRRGYVVRGDRLLVVTDSKNAVQYLSGDVPSRKKIIGFKATDPAKRAKGQPRRKPIYGSEPKNPVLAELAARVLGIFAEHGLELAQARWTKGHDDGRTRQSWVNRLVDQAARKATKAKVVQGKSSAK